MDNQPEFEYKDVTAEELQKLIEEGKIKVEDTISPADAPNRKVTVKFYTTPTK